jgi:hypothetical protein
MSRIFLLLVTVCIFFCLLSATEAKPRVSRPLIDSPGNNEEKRQKLTFLADVVKTEPSVAKLDAAAEDEWNGEDGDGENRFQKETNYNNELKQLEALVKQSRELIKGKTTNTYKHQT